MAGYGNNLCYSAGLGTFIAVFLCAVLVQQVASFYVGDRDARLAPADALSHYDLDADLGEAPVGIPTYKRSDDLPEYFTEQKRYLCRKFFIYNPVKGRCMPTLLALRKGRKTRAAAADDN